MIKVSIRLFFAAILILIFSSIFFAQTKKAKKISYGERLMTALINSKTIPAQYGDEGFFHLELSPDVIRILRLGKRAVPLLIKHLDDRRIFKYMMFYGDPNNPEKVTAGEGVLELLTYMIKVEAPVFDMKCIKDEFRTPEDPCISGRFEFGRRGKRNWLKAYRAGKIHYEKNEY